VTRATAPRVQYDCRKCPAYCCSIYGVVEVTDRDLARLAKHLGVSQRVAEERFTKRYDGQRVLRRRRDELLGEACRFLDEKTRGCTIYDGRPKACRDYPGKPRCAYFEMIEFEREIQQDPDVIPLIQISFRSK
jgi:Fe-S-cluster containining protein